MNQRVRQLSLIEVLAESLLRRVLLFCSMVSLLLPFKFWICWERERREEGWWRTCLVRAKVGVIVADLKVNSELADKSVYGR